ncbi:MAG: homoserine O-succinyltransferase, partial [Rhodospirillales bacterium]|nr:homoserine O-succinyltransferase [Rhodospirillales bacterium]
EMTMIAPTNYVPKNTSREHMLDFYHPFADIKAQKFDGLIITGAPIEKLEFEQVEYWDELGQIFDWAVHNVHSMFTLCWGAQAALNHFYDIPKYQLPQKRFGVYTHRVLDNTPLMMHGLNDEFPVPVSRHTENRREDFEKFPNLDILVESEQSGMCLVRDSRLNHIHMFNHLEYESNTLDDEYRRDVASGDKNGIPANYYRDDNPDNEPVNTWRSSAHLLFNNWLNDIYQSTPYDIDLIGSTYGRELVES